MALLNTADRVYNGPNRATAVYAGATKVWPPKPFSPLDIAGLVTWIDPKQDLFADGATIASYTEHSNDHRVYSGNGGVIFRNGGDPRIEFNGGQHLQFDTLNLGPTGFTFVAVNSLTAPAQPMMLLAHHSSNDGYEMRWDSMAMQTAASWQTQFTYNIHTTPDVANVKQQHIWRFNIPGGTSDAWVGSSRNTFASSVMPNVPTYMFIGVRYGGYWYTGNLYEAMVFVGAISDADLGKLQTYLTAKHQLAGA